MALYTNVPLRGAILGMQNALAALAGGGRMDEASALVASFAERQWLVQKINSDEVERRYALG